jgi:hypothetical protein
MMMVNYDDMSDEQLRRYFIEHRNDKVAFQAYLDRLNQRPREIITTVDDPDFETKIQAAIERKIQAADNSDRP